MMSSIASPCIRNCCLNEKDICLGCFRSIDEILIWGTASDEQKSTALALSNTRRKQYEQSFKPFKSTVNVNTPSKEKSK